MESLAEIRLEPKILNATHLYWLVNLPAPGAGLASAQSQLYQHTHGQQSGEETKVPLLMHLWLLWFCYDSSL